ncbi:MAG: TIGR02117 family protein [Cryomorphaceae bacterium]|nr:TIGR02117 family protein [Cryomorphaceae bacterium]
MKKALKIVLKTVVGFLAFLLVYALFALVLSVIPSSEKPGGDITVYLVSNGVHTDIAVPTKNHLMDWSNFVDPAATRGKREDLPWISLGWGHRGFYLETPTWSDLTVGTALNAAFGLGESVLHATFYKEFKESDQCFKLNLSNEQYEQLIAFISDSFAKDEKGKTISVATNALYGDNDVFYEATGKYSLLHTCNTWANNGLKACEKKASFWTPLEWGIFYHYRK